MLFLHHIVKFIRYNHHREREMIWQSADIMKESQCIFCWDKYNHWATLKIHSRNYFININLLEFLLLFFFFLFQIIVMIFIDNRYKSALNWFLLYSIWLVKKPRKRRKKNIIRSLELSAVDDLRPANNFNLFES